MFDWKGHPLDWNPPKSEGIAFLNYCWEIHQYIGVLNATTWAFMHPVNPMSSGKIKWRKPLNLSKYSPRLLYWLQLLLLQTLLLNCLQSLLCPLVPQVLTSQVLCKRSWNNNFLQALVSTSSPKPAGYGLLAFVKQLHIHSPGDTDGIIPPSGDRKWLAFAQRWFLTLFIFLHSILHV